MKCTDCSQTIKPIASIDIDGTLGDYHEHFRRFAENYLGRSLPKNYQGNGEFDEFLGIVPKELYRQVKLAYRQGGNKRWMPLISDGVAEFFDVLKRLNFEIWLTTTRPWNRLDSVDPDTQEWLKRNEIPYDHLLYDDFKYQRLHQIVGHHRVIAIFEDLPNEYENAAGWFGSNVTRLVGRVHNTIYRLHYNPKTVLSWVQAEDFVLRNLRAWTKGELS